MSRGSRRNPSPWACQPGGEQRRTAKRAQQRIAHSPARVRAQRRGSRWRSPATTGAEGAVRVRRRRPCRSHPDPTRARSGPRHLPVLVLGRSERVPRSQLGGTGRAARSRRGSAGRASRRASDKHAGHLGRTRDRDRASRGGRNPARGRNRGRARERRPRPRALRARRDRVICRADRSSTGSRSCGKQRAEPDAGRSSRSRAAKACSRRVRSRLPGPPAGSRSSASRMASLERSRSRRPSRAHVAP